MFFSAKGYVTCFCNLGAHLESTGVNGRFKSLNLPVHAVWTWSQRRYLATFYFREEISSMRQLPKHSMSSLAILSTLI